MGNIAICEDNELQLLLLEDIIKQYLSTRKETYHVKTYTSGKLLVDDLIDGYLDVECILLDIEMPELNGIDTARLIRDHSFNVPIIFISSSNNYAFESYEVKAAGYLTKPCDMNKISLVLNHILKENEVDRLTITVNRQKRYIKIDQITYIESLKRNITVHLVDGTSYTFNSSISKVEEQLKSNKFLRTHQSFLVNMDYIDDINQDFVLKDKTIIPISVRSRKEIYQAFITYFRKHRKE